MDPFFHGGMKLGQSEACREAGVDGTTHVEKAASEMRRARLTGIAKHLDGIGRAWKRRKTEVLPVLEAIQQRGGADYQRVSSGYWMGKSMEACRQRIKKNEVAKAKSELTTWLTDASAHAYALIEQKFYPNMEDFRPKINGLIGPINSIVQASEFSNHFQLIENVAKQVGNGIR